MKIDKILLELEAELLAIEAEKKALGMPADMRNSNLDNYTREQLITFNEVLKRQANCLQRVQSFIGKAQKGRSDIN